jgi:hypothetical protein
MCNCFWQGGGFFLDSGAEGERRGSEGARHVILKHFRKWCSP